MSEQEARVIHSFSRHYGLTFHRPELLKLALTHRSYLSVTGQGPRESNERLEFLGDSVLGLVTSEFLYRKFPDEHEGQLTKTKSLLVSKAILSRRALAMGLGRFVLMSHSEVESGGRQRLSILADAFESVVGAIYLDLGFEAARQFIHRWLLQDTSEIVADKRHTNFKSHLQEFVQSTYRTHPVYRIRSQIGPDHSKQFNVEVMVSRKVLGVGQGQNKKEAEQAAARNALEQVERPNRRHAATGERPAATPGHTPETDSERGDARRRRRRGRRGGRGRRAEEPGAETEPGEERPAKVSRPLPPLAEERVQAPVELEPPPPVDVYELEEVGRPEGPMEERHIDPYAIEPETARLSAPSGLEKPRPGAESESGEPAWGAGDGEPLNGVDASHEEREPEPEPDSEPTPEGSKPERSYGRRSSRSRRPGR